MCPVQRGRKESLTERVQGKEKTDDSSRKNKRNGDRTGCGTGGCDGCKTAGESSLRGWDSVRGGDIPNGGSEGIHSYHAGGISGDVRGCGNCSDDKTGRRSHRSRSKIYRKPGIGSGDRGLLYRKTDPGISWLRDGIGAGAGGKTGTGSGQILPGRDFRRAGSDQSTGSSICGNEIYADRWYQSEKCPFLSGK